MMMTDPVKEQEYYNKPLFHSYSSLSKLLFSPQLYYNHYIMGVREDVTVPSMVAGRVIHCLLLDNGTFNDQFVVSSEKLPKDKNLALVTNIFNTYQGGALQDYSVDILEQLKDLDLHQSLTKDEDRLAKVLNPVNVNYFEYLKARTTRTVVDQETLDQCRKSESVLRDNCRIMELMGFQGKKDGIEVFNEQELRIQGFSIYPFGLKGILDNLVIDHENKEIRINDLKCISKSLHEFKESVEYYRYDLQAAIQALLVSMNHDLGYKIKFRFIVIDKYQQVYAFPVSDLTMAIWNNKLEEALMIARWHFHNKRYELPYQFSCEEVTL